jgi:K+-transporting ATPase KdpF subunit
VAAGQPGGRTTVVAPEAPLDWENLLALVAAVAQVAAVALVGYLVYTLVHPERF